MTEATWCTIESDPGVFSELISSMGVKYMQVEEIYELDKESIMENLSPIHGLIFLFKWRSEEQDNRLCISPSQVNTDIFFANQVINNACATQAILSILLNSTEDVDIGAELLHFKQFTREFPPEMKGLAISNSEMIRVAHNNFAKPSFVSDGTLSSSAEEDDVYHFISYIHIRDSVYELDGLKSGPILLGNCPKSSWLDVVFPVIQKRIERYSRSEIRFNLMALIKDRRAVLREELSECEALKRNLQGTDSNEMREVETRIETIQETIKLEEEKTEFRRIENIRRRHNYIPLFINMMKVFAETGHLQTLLQHSEKKG